MSDLRQLLLTAIISGIAPIFVLALGAFLYHVIRAPAELAEIAHDTYESGRLQKEDFITRLTTERRALEQRLKSLSYNLFFTIEY